MDSFEGAEKTSERFKKHVSLQKDKTDSLFVYDANSNLDPSYQRLHFTMRELANQRQHETGILKKTKWALYEKKRFDTMIEDITGFVDELVDLFPAAQNDQKRLCDTEVSAIKENQDLVLLKDAISNDDRMLEEAVNKAMESRGSTFTNWNADGNSKMWAGDDNGFGVESKSHFFNTFSVSGNADVRLGNVNRGK